MTSKKAFLTISTPEGISFSFQLAGPVIRFLAWGTDFLIIFGMTMVIRKFLGLFDIISQDLTSAIYLLSYFLLSVGYGIAMEWFWQGQTLGKRLFRLRVTDAQGLRLQFSQVVIRNLLRFADSLPGFYMVGGLACLISEQGQRLGDLAANTLVVWHPRIEAPDLVQLLADKYNSFQEYPHLAARLRHHVSPQEAGIAMQALLRRDELMPRARVGLFSEIVSYFKEIVTFPEEAAEGISDEQYIRNMVDILFRDSR
ncbi:MAG: RDD family protein [Desulfobacteraceae bacterium 4572_88]|nr:MAG: RDD family protein [Desulfobacteraceae bacterium 4572_88]